MQPRLSLSVARPQLRALIPYSAHICVSVAAPPFLLLPILTQSASINKCHCKQILEGPKCVEKAQVVVVFFNTSKKHCAYTQHDKFDTGVTFFSAQ